MADWFRNQFGKTLAELYFIPYNKKIWGNEPANMDPSWVKDKLPIPNKKQFFEALVTNMTDNMPHASFYYPKSNNQNTFIDALAKDVDIVYNYNVNKIKKLENGKWKINDEKEFDILINTTPLDRFPSLIVGVPDSVIDAAKMLRYNKISNVLWKSKPTEKTWTYLPEDKYKFHRYIHIGSYYRPLAGYSISESVGEHTKEELIMAGKHDNFLLEPLDYNQSEHAYVVFDQNYKYAVPHILNYLEQEGIHSIGRFGEWQYYNMDVCMKRSMELTERLVITL